MSVNHRHFRQDLEELSKLATFSGEELGPFGSLPRIDAPDGPRVPGVAQVVGRFLFRGVAARGPQTPRPTVTVRSEAVARLPVVFECDELAADNTAVSY